MDPFCLKCSWVRVLSLPPSPFPTVPCWAPKAGAAGERSGEGHQAWSSVATAPAHGRLCCRTPGSGSAPHQGAPAPAPAPAPRSRGPPGQASRATQCSTAWWGLPASSCGPALPPPNSYVRPPARQPACPYPCPASPPALAPHLPAHLPLPLALPILELGGRGLSGDIRAKAHRSGVGVQREESAMTPETEEINSDIEAGGTKSEVLPKPQIHHQQREHPAPEEGDGVGGDGPRSDLGQKQGRGHPVAQASEQDWVGTRAEQSDRHRPCVCVLQCGAGWGALRSGAGALR